MTIAAVRLNHAVLFVSDLERSLPSRTSSCRCASVSTPSATTDMPRLCANAMMVRMIGASSWPFTGASPISRTKLWSIFSVLIGRRCR